MHSFDVAGYHLRGLIEGLRALRIDVADLLDACSFDHEQLADPEVRFAAEHVALLWSAAEQRYAKDSFGFDLAMHVPFGNIELLDYLVAGCATVGTGIECLAHQARVSGSEFTLAIHDHIHEREAGRRIVAEPQHRVAALPKSVSEYTWTLLISRFRKACGPQWKPVLWLREKPDVAPIVLLDALGRNPETADEEALFVPDSQWSLENSRRDPLLQHFLLTHEFAPRSPKHDFLGTLHGAMVSAMHRGDPSIGRVATRLGFTPRTLQRRLDDDGLTFQQVLEDLRQALACQYLSNSRLSVAEIGGLLAYSDATAFGRAFWRWTDRTPADYRTQPRAAPGVLPAHQPGAFDK